jgi:phosphoribosylformimino-5-aminoimidazole carboxamide ribotide isomerase
VFPKAWAVDFEFLSKREGTFVMNERWNLDRTPVTGVCISNKGTTPVTGEVDRAPVVLGQSIIERKTQKCKKEYWDEQYSSFRQKLRSIPRYSPQPDVSANSSTATVQIFLACSLFYHWACTLQSCKDTFTQGLESKNPSMFLIIPTIPIKHGHCGATIASLHRERESLVYSLDPVERARLLRKENAKAIHLEFRDCQPWEQESLHIIQNIRGAVDIPLEIGLSALPQSQQLLASVFEAGANRVFLPVGTSSDAFSDLWSVYGRKVVQTFLPSELTSTVCTRLHDRRIDRIALELSPPDEVGESTLEAPQHPWVDFEHAVMTAKANGIHVTALHGVAGYPDLHRIQSLSPTVDSLVMCKALNENRFPCQLLWRELEEEFALRSGSNTNLWTNPLEGKPHV